jgi:hypothetical protein
MALCCRPDLVLIIPIVLQSDEMLKAFLKVITRGREFTGHHKWSDYVLVIILRVFTIES